MFVRSFRTFCKFVDQSVSMETRLSNGQKILKLLYDCILRADREESTMYWYCCDQSGFTAGIGGPPIDGHCAL